MQLQFQNFCLCLELCDCENKGMLRYKEIDRSRYWNAWKKLVNFHKDISFNAGSGYLKEMQYIMHAYKTPDNPVWHNAHLWREELRLKKAQLRTLIVDYITDKCSHSCFSSKSWKFSKKRCRRLQFIQKLHTNIWNLEKTPLIYFHFLMTSTKWKRKKNLLRTEWLIQQILYFHWIVSHFQNQ